MGWQGEKASYIAGSHPSHPQGGLKGTIQEFLTVGAINSGVLTFPPIFKYAVGAQACKDSKKR